MFLQSVKCCVRGPIWHVSCQRVGNSLALIRNVRKGTHRQNKYDILFFVSLLSSSGIPFVHHRGRHFEYFWNFYYKLRKSSGSHYIREYRHWTVFVCFLLFLTDRGLASAGFCFSSIRTVAYGNSFSIKTMFVLFPYKRIRPIINF